ncbi:hypothetical protein B0H21DRAFT_12289 [Amylocystis lapponica]|nr:hypothetical protein B0H21DRAFT_12289 [Amylocystis lapponica]
MKRHVQDQSDSERKRVRREVPGVVDGHNTHADDPFHPSLEKKLADLSMGTTDDTGFLQGRVRMKWPPSGGKLSVLLTLADALSQCNVYFSGTCTKYFHLLAFNIGDEFQLSLRGAVVESTNNTRCTLRFERGVVVKFLKTKNPAHTDQIVNTWDLEKEYLTSHQVGQQEPAYDDWYATPALPPSNPVPSSGRGPQVVEHANQGTSFAPQAKKHSPPADATIPDDYMRSHITASTSSSALKAVVGAPVKAAKPSPPPGNGQRISVEEAQSDSSEQVRSKNRRTPAQPLPPPPPPPDRVTEAKTSKKKEKRERKALRQQLRESAGLATNTVSDAPVSSVSASIAPEEPSQAEVTMGETGDLGVRRFPDGAVARPTDKSTQDKVSPAPQSSKTPVVSSTGSFVSSTASSNEHERLHENLRGSGSDTGNSRRALSSVPSTVVHGTSSRATPVSKPSISPSHTASASNTVSSILCKTENEELDPSMVVGFHSGVANYVPLGKVTERSPYNVIGVVAAADGINRTSTGEYKTRIVVADPSIFKDRDFSINLFQKTEGRLPEPKRGDILLLRRMHGDEYQGNYCGSGPSYKPWVWSIFDPRTGEVRRAADRNAVNIVNFQPNEQELQYCLRLDDWWRAAVSDAGADVTVHRVADMVVRGRVHRLIRDASPHAEPNGFFDCTVEVLYGYMNPANNNQVYSLYVTDYTRNPSISAVQRDWCPPSLAEQVLKMEMWGDAAELGPKMKPGEYYFMGNSRMKIGEGGDLEGTISEVQKIRKMDEDMLEGEPHFEALLRRKKEWEAQVEENGGSEFPHLLIEHAEENRFFRCTVEVMSISHKDESSILYVTDYTSRSDMVAIAPSAAPSALTDRVLKVWLHDGQIATSKNLEPGDLISILNVRLKASGSTHLLAGRLGGNQRLINKLQPHGSSNEDLKALLRRKTEWETSQAQGKGNKLVRSNRGRKDLTEKPAAKSPPGFVSNASVALNKSKQTGFTTIAAVQASEACPAVFRIKARIVDFYPAELRHFTLLRCTKCGDDIPESRRICTECDDAMEDTSFVRPVYQFFFVVEDEERSQLTISANDDQSSLLKDLAPADFTTDEDALEVFTKRLTALLGNLLEVRDGVAQRRLGDAISDLDTPSLDLTVGSWLVDDGRDSSSRAYLMLKHNLAG